MDTAKLCEMIEDWPEEKQGTGQFYDSNGCFCAVGWLLHKNGTPLEVIQGMFTGCFSEDILSDQWYSNEIKAAKKLKETLGASTAEIASIWQASDGTERPELAVSDSETPKQRVQSKFCGGVR
jgi:hypothetical protein